MHGPFFNYYPDKKVWIECEYVDGILMRYGREESGDEKNEEIPEIMKDYPEIKELFGILVKKEFLKNFDRTKVEKFKKCIIIFIIFFFFIILF